MTTEILKHVLEALKLAPRYLVAVAVLFGVLLFCDAAFLQRFGVADLAKDNRAVIGVGFLACCAVIAIEAGYWVVAKMRANRAKWNGNLRVSQRLRRLTEEEKQVLRLYIGQQTRTQYFCLDNGVINGLCQAGVLAPAARTAGYFNFPHNITQTAWDVLNKAPVLLD